MSDVEPRTTKALVRVLEIYARESPNGLLDLNGVSRPDFRFHDPCGDIAGFDAVMAHFAGLACRKGCATLMRCAMDFMYDEVSTSPHLVGSR